MYSNVSVTVIYHVVSPVRVHTCIILLWNWNYVWIYIHLVILQVVFWRRSWREKPRRTQEWDRPPLNPQVGLAHARKYTLSFRLCNWLSFRRLVSWINHLPPACWSTFWKSNFKQQLGCRFDIIDNLSYFFVFWHMQLYMSWYIGWIFGFTFLNILYFFKYSSINIFHRRSFYTFYWCELVKFGCSK